MSGLNITVKCTEIEAVKDMITKLEVENEELKKDLKDAYKSESEQLKFIVELESNLNKISKECQMKTTEINLLTRRNQELNLQIIKVTADREDKLKEVERLLDFARNNIDNTVYNMLDTIKTIYNAE